MTVTKSVLSACSIDTQPAHASHAPHSELMQHFDMIFRRQRHQLSSRPPMLLPRAQLLHDERVVHRRAPNRTGVPAAGFTEPRRDPTGTYAAGLHGEQVVADALRRERWKILGHRVRTRLGEIDVIARRGDTVIFVEVKTAGPGRIDVASAVTARARQRIRRAAVAWMSHKPHLHRGVTRYRFDVFLVFRDRAGAVIRIERILDAF